MTSKSIFNSRPIPRIFLVALLVLLALSSYSEVTAGDLWGNADGPLMADQAFSVESRVAPDGTTELQWSIAKGYYLYRDRLAAVKSEDGLAVPLKTPGGVRKDDPNFGQVEVYFDHVTATLPAGLKGDVQLSWQGCATAGLCYPPQHLMLRLPLAADDYLSTLAATKATNFDGDVSALLSGASGSDTKVGHVLRNESLVVTMPLFLLLGIGLAFTPCMFPMIPILSGIIVGSGAGRGRALVLSLAFVVPMALVYAGMGILAALVGTNIQAILEQPWFILGFAAVFVMLAMSMFDLYTLQLPSFISDRLSGRASKGGSIAGAAAMGVVSALLVGPCMTAPLAGTLLFIAQTGKAATGGLLLLALGIGTGIPLVGFAILSRSAMPRPGQWMSWVKGAYGFAMLAMAIWMAQRVLSPSVVLLISAGWLISLALSLYFSAKDGGVGLRVSATTAAVLLGLWGTAALAGAAAGGNDILRPLAVFAGSPPKVGVEVAATSSQTVTSSASLQVALQEAEHAGVPALVEFTADWCTSCRTIERSVFSRPEVNQALVDRKRILVDVTAGTSDQQELMKKYGVIGPPTLLFFDASGQENRGQRIVGEFEADDLLSRLHSTSRS